MQAAHLCIVLYCKLLHVTVDFRWHFFLHALATSMKALRRALLLWALPLIAALLQQPFCSTRALQHAKQSTTSLSAQDDADQRASKKHHSAAAVFRLVRGKARLFTKYGRAR
jgi:hypothetical protein